MNPAKEKILDRIKKLLRMKRGGTAAEVETALALAAELARKHGIELDGVDPDAEPDRPITQLDAATSARIQWECKYAGLVCQQFFNVNMMLHNPKTFSIDGVLYRARRGNRFHLTFIGTERDIQIATYIYHFLVRHFRHCWKTGRGRLRNRQAFFYGMYHGLCSKLDEQRTGQVTGTGLILLDRALARRDAYCKAQYPNSKSTSSKPDGDADAAKYAGYVAGRKTEIRSGLAPTGQATLLLLPN